MKKVNKLRFDDQLLVNAARQLKGRIRVGGTLSDQVIYQMDTKGKACSPKFKPIQTEDKHHAWTDGCVSAQTVDELIQFAEKSNVQAGFKVV